MPETSATRAACYKMCETGVKGAAAPGVWLKNRFSSIKSTQINSVKLVTGVVLGWK